MNLTKRVTAFFLMLILCLALLPAAALAADAPIISYDRYDGVKTDAYEGEWSTYSVKVENLKEGDSVSYRWQFTIKCCEPTADQDHCSTEWQTSWFDASDKQCSWLRGFDDSPSIEVYNKEGAASVDDQDRYVFRCVVTLNGKTANSPVFEQHCRSATNLTEIRAGGVDAPKSGGKPDFSATAVSEHTSIEAVRWTYIASNGYTSELNSTTEFAYTAKYQVRVTVKLDSGYRAALDSDEPVICYLDGTQCLAEQPEGDSGRVVLVRNYELFNGTLNIIPYEYDIDSLLAFNEQYQYPAWDPTNTVTYIDVVANDTEMFQCGPKRLPDGAAQAGYSVVVNFYWYDGSTWHNDTGTPTTFTDGSAGAQLQVATGSVGATRSVVQILTLCKNGVPIENKSISRYFCTTAKEGLPPKIWRFLGNDQYKSIGDSAYFYCKAAGTDNQYLWMVYKLNHGRYEDYYGWSPIGSTNCMLQFENVTKEMDGWIFKCRVTNAYGTTFSDEVALYVSGEPAEEVGITGITPPAAGAVSNWSGASVTNGTGTVVSGAVSWVRATDPAGAASAEYVAAFQESISVLGADERFRAGETYYALVNIETAGDYRFVKNTTRVTFNGKSGKIIYLEPDRLCAAFPFALACDGSNCPTAGYTDVPPASNWAHEGIDFCVASGIMGSTKTDKLVFEPNTACTRAMIVSLLYRLSGEPAVTYSSIFPDVKAGQWYTDAVIWGYQNDVVSGYSDGRFAPNDPITREQMAVILQEYTYNIAHKNVSAQADLSGFADAGKVTWSKDAVSWAVAEELISGKTSGTKTILDPQGKATRAEAASLLMRYIQNILAD